MHCNRHDSNNCITIRKKKHTQDTTTITKTKNKQTHGNILFSFCNLSQKIWERERERYHYPSGGLITDGQLGGGWATTDKRRLGARDHDSLSPLAPLHGARWLGVNQDLDWEFGIRGLFFFGSLVLLCFESRWRCVGVVRD